VTFQKQCERFAVKKLNFDQLPLCCLPRGAHEPSHLVVILGVGVILAALAMGVVIRVVVTGDCVTRKQLTTRLIRLGILPWSEKMARAEQSLLGMGPVTGPGSPGVEFHC
jgi:hypothetical protein